MPGCLGTPEEGQGVSAVGLFPMSPYGLRGQEAQVSGGGWGTCVWVIWTQVGGCGCIWVIWTHICMLLRARVCLWVFSFIHLPVRAGTQ